MDLSFSLVLCKSFSLSLFFFFSPKNESMEREEEEEKLKRVDIWMTTGHFMLFISFKHLFIYLFLFFFMTR